MPKAIQTDFIFHTLPTVSRGKGFYVFYASGKRYLDGSRGLDLFSLGHPHPEVNDAIKQRLVQIANNY